MMTNGLPDGWRLFRFGEIFTRIDRKFIINDTQIYKCIGLHWYGNGAFVREQLLGADITRKQQWVIRSGDIVYNKLFAWKNAFAVADDSVDSCIVSDKFPTYRIKSDLVDSNYLAYYFKTLQLGTQAQALSKGAAAISKLTLNPPQFWDLTIPLPSIPEQRHIVARIDDILSYITMAQELRAKSQEEALKIFTAAIESIYSNHQSLYKSHILNDLVDPHRGISYGVVQLGEQVDGGVPTLRAGDLKQFSISAENVKTIAPEIAARYIRTKLRGGELLLKIRGGYGEVAVCPPESASGNVSREIAVIPLIDEVIPKYGMYLLAAPSILGKMTNNLRGTSYQGLNLSDIRNLFIPVPPLDIQRHNVAYLDRLWVKVNSLLQLMSKMQEELTALLPSILDKAFKGEL